MKFTICKRLRQLTSGLLALVMLVGTAGLLAGPARAAIGDRYWEQVTPLKDIYADDFLMGTVISPGDFNNPDKWDFIQYHFNALTPENATKPDSMWRNPEDEPNFRDADTIAEHVNTPDSGFYTVGHAFAWHNQSQSWPDRAEQYTQDVYWDYWEAKYQLERYIRTVAGHFEETGHQFDAWDVVNEAMRDNPDNPTDWRNALRHGDLPIERPAAWYQAYSNGGNGWDYVYDAFCFARKYAPNAKLFYNDFNDEELANKAIAIVSMVNELNARYAAEHPEDPRMLIEGIGIQSHYSTRLNLDNLEHNLQLYASTGCEIHITELDVQYNGGGERVGSGWFSSYKLNEEQEKEQAEFYARLFMLYKKYAAYIERVTFWGTNDQNWRASGCPLLFDADWNVKEAYYAVADPEGYLGIGKEAPKLSGFVYNGEEFLTHGDGLDLYEVDVNVPDEVSQISFSEANLSLPEGVTATVSLSNGGRVTDDAPCTATVRVAWADAPQSYTEYQIHFGHMAVAWEGDSNHADTGYRSSAQVRFSDGETVLTLEQQFIGDDGSVQTYTETVDPLPKNESGLVWVETGSELSDAYLNTVTLKKSIYDGDELVAPARATDFPEPESYYQLTTDLQPGKTYIVVSSESGLALTHRAVNPVRADGYTITQDVQGYAGTAVTVEGDRITDTDLQDNVRFILLPLESPASETVAGAGQGYALLSLVHGGLIQPYVLQRSEGSDDTLSMTSGSTIGDKDLDRAVWYHTDFDPVTKETTLYQRTPTEGLTYVLAGNHDGFAARGGTGDLSEYEQYGRVKFYEYVTEPTYVYDITTEARGSGTVTTDVSFAEAGQTVRAYAVASDGVVLEELRIEDADGASVPQTPAEGGAYFTMPDSSVHVTAVFSDAPAEEPDEPGSSGGSSGGTGHSGSNAITVQSDGHGTVKLSRDKAPYGAKVTITVRPDAGYVLDSLVVRDFAGNPVKVTDEGNNQYSFLMPVSRVTVEAVFVPSGESGSALPFTDVPENAWYYDAVVYAYENGLMSGTSATTFSPNAQTTRGMIVTILYRLEGNPNVTAAGGFTDVAGQMYYADAVAWAAANGIVNGYNDTTFGPNDPITREQMAAILYRYAQYKGMDTTAAAELTGYTDAGSVSAYAEPAMAWACGEGLISGTSATTLSPLGTATRAQVVTILMRFAANS